MIRNTLTELLKLKCDFSNVVKYKINIPKPVVFVNRISEQTKNKIKKTIPFTTASKRIKCLDRNVKGAQNL